MNRSMLKFLKDLSYHYKSYRDNNSILVSLYKAYKNYQYTKNIHKTIDRLQDIL